MIKNSIEKEERHIETLIERYPVLAQGRQDIMAVYKIIAECYISGGKLLIAGNGGSAADSEHIAGELMKSFGLPRQISIDLSDKLKRIDSVRGEWLAQNLECALAAVPLVAHESLSTAYLNDVDGKGIFAQQLLGYGRPGDVFLGISTSGNSENVLYAAVAAKALGIRVVALTGEDGGRLKEYCDAVVRVPAKETYMIQELHMPVYHCICLMLEEKFFRHNGGRA